MIYMELVKLLSNGHSPQIRRNGKLLVRMCRMRVTVWRMSANVGECIECRMYRVRGKGLANVGRMYRVRGEGLANVG